MNTTPKVGTRVICNGYPGTVTRVCEWSNSMVEVRLASGLVCVDRHELVEEKAWTALSGTRRVVERSQSDFRVVCATCGGGGVNRYRERSLALKAAVRDSGKRCPICGAA